MHHRDLERELTSYILPKTHIPDGMYELLMRYLQLLLKWNAHTNLTAIREPVEIVRRHFGESLFAAQHLGECETLLDFGSGAGFPGLPIQLLRPDLQVTLAESQNKKSTFLREVVRTLGLTTSIWAGRVEAMPEANRFDVVTMRAVDGMETAIQAASERAGRKMVILSTSKTALPTADNFTLAESILFPNSRDQRFLSMIRSK